MQQVEEFMQDIFRARKAEEKIILANRSDYRQKYFTDDCFWDSRKGTLEMIETERVVSSDKSGSAVLVITEYMVPFYSSGGRLHKRRYHLRAAGESWLICHVDHQCPVCLGQGDEGCKGCKGQHWK
jgi:hypothetical protein